MRILVGMSALVLGIDHTDWSNLGKLLAARAGTLVALVVIGLVVQWIFHRLVDRVVRKAEDGVLPDRINQVAVGRTDSDVSVAPG